MLSISDALLLRHTPPLPPQAGAERETPFGSHSRCMRSRHRRRLLTLQCVSLTYPAQIVLPTRLRNLLETDRSLKGAVDLTLADFELWLGDNKLAFFPDYTDHGPVHVRDVIESAVALIADPAWPALTAADAAALVLSAVLHDCAMHLSEEGFLQLISGSFPPRPTLASDRPWPQLWDAFLAEASRFDGRTLMRLFGDTTKPRRPPKSPSGYTKRDRLLIGDFLRRHHPRLAHEIAMFGVPGPSAERLQITRMAEPLRFIAGLIARSHGIDLRDAAELLPDDERRQFAYVHAPFLMGVLRIADYIQIQRERAPGQVLLVRGLTSPFSRREWQTHGVIDAIHATHEDPEALFVKTAPPSAQLFVKIRHLLSDIQRELDMTWAVLGEVYGRFKGLDQLGLTIRRIRSNLDDVEAFGRTVPYLPRHVHFDTAGADLLKLLIVPLYGATPSVGIRELIQNAVDAIRERRDLATAPALSSDAPAVMVDVINTGEHPRVVVTDHGVGTAADVVTNYFLRAGASYRHSDAWRIQHTDASGRSRVLRSGRFGVGALAAFLLGDTVEVTTRHVDAVEGLSFTGTVSDDVIEIRWSSADVGTTVTIPLSTEAASALRLDLSWDWYCLDGPVVERRQNGQPVKQSTVWPAEHADLPPEWHRVRHPDYSDIQWSCRTGYSPQLAVNGLKVIGGPASSPHEGAPRYLHGNANSSDTLVIETPQLSVFDPDGNLPLTLQRNALSVRTYPFNDELLDGVLEDFIAYATMTAPADPALLGGWWASKTMDYPIIRTPSFQADSRLLPFWCAPGGWGLLDDKVFRTLAPERILVTTSPSSNWVGMATIDYTREHVLAMDIGKSSVQAASTWLRFCLGHDSRALNLLRPLRRTGGVVVITAEWFYELESSANISRQLRANIKAVEHLGAWAIMYVGNAKPEMFERDFQTFKAISPRTEYEGFAELLLDPPRAPSVESKIASKWWEIVGGPCLPYAVEDREHIKRHEGVVASMKAYEQLFESGKLKRLKSST